MFWSSTDFWFKIAIVNIMLIMQFVNGFFFFQALVLFCGLITGCYCCCCCCCCCNYCCGTMKPKPQDEDGAYQNLNVSYYYYHHRYSYCHNWLFFSYYNCEFVRVCFEVSHVFFFSQWLVFPHEQRHHNKGRYLSLSLLLHRFIPSNIDTLSLLWYVLIFRSLSLCIAE